ncbi:RNaseH domain-containing protein [Streptomyces sp. Ru73]|uniref:RNaseH domain-containing protein n=1 Tax=Streptomyces sp. Ru73 TaxID=2080748 RepID=UPI0015E3CDB8|nr:RNaseH domain-containing protein [Streptomyces sp. Ru73]
MPTYRRQQAAVFVFDEHAHLPVQGYKAACPAEWLKRLEPAWASLPRRRKDPGNLPSSSLSQIAQLLDPRISSIHWNLHEPEYLRATAPVDMPFHLAVAAWAATDVAPHLPELDWPEILGEHPLVWEPHDTDLAHHKLHPNGTASPGDAVFKLLPSLLAERVTSSGLHLRGHHYKAWLGPTRSDGRRAVYLGPPTPLTDRDGATGMYTPYIEFHLETVPGEAQVRIHADLHMARFASLPSAYVPRRGAHPATVTVLLHADSGFMTSTERRMLVRASATVLGRSDEARWEWSPGVSRLLALLTRHRYPNPDVLRTAPSTAAESSETAVAAYAVHSNGMKYYLPAEPDAGEKGRRRTAGHPAEPGYQPIDHLEVFDALVPVLAPLGLIPARTTSKASTKTKALHPVEVTPGRHYQMEHWTTSPRTQEALHLALTHKLGLNASDGTAMPGAPVTYTGPFTVTVHHRDPGDLVGGIPRSEGDVPAVRRSENEQATAERARHIGAAFPRSPELRAAVIELEDGDFFLRTRQGDPKPLLKKTLPALGRRVQCMRPVRPAPASGSKQKMLGGTDHRVSDIERAASSVLDALRQVGHVSDIPTPHSVTGPFELSTVWISRAPDGRHVPMLIRMRPGQETMAQLMPTPCQRDETELPFTELPEALTAGRGRIHLARNYRAVTDFIIQALALDSTTDRVFLARAAVLRRRELWPWLQDAHLTPNALQLPGTRFEEPDAVPAHRKPGDHPGLRIIRVREAADGDAVPHLFGVPWDEEHQRRAPGSGRFSGLARISDTAFYGVNPRSDQNQTPLGITKLDPAQPQNASWSVSNPRPLEIVPAFLQDCDDPAEFAMYVQAQRRSYTHTANDTQWPALMHLAELMDEYLV